MGPTCCKFLLDSGAAVSVIRFDALDEKWYPDIIAAGPETAIGADGLPLEVVGKVTLPVSLDRFQAQQEFTVVRFLTADCILGADFLVKHGAVIDCRNATLTIGDQPRLQVPISFNHTQPDGAVDDNLTVVLSETTKLPGRSDWKHFWCGGIHIV